MYKFYATSKNILTDIKVTSKHSLTDINHSFISNNNRRSVLLATTFLADHVYPNTDYSPVYNSDVVSCQQDIKCAGHTKNNTAGPNPIGIKQGPVTSQNGGL